MEFDNMDADFLKELTDVVYDVFAAAKKEGMLAVSMADILACLGYPPAVITHFSEELNKDLYNEYFKIPSTFVDAEYIVAKMKGQIH